MGSRFNIKYTRGWARLLRIKHWLKNLLVFFPLVFAGRAFDTSALFQAFAAFAAFCLAASVVYVVNDVCDADRDKLHPVKRDRPVASGAISKRAAMAAGGVLLVLALACTLAFAQATQMAAAVLAVYVGLNVAYSTGLKNVPILDIAILASGYILRILFGGAFCGISVSAWLFLTVLSLSIFLALGKRCGEIKRYGCDARKSLKSYSAPFLDKNMYVYLGLGLVFYSLWTLKRMGGDYLGGDAFQWALVAGVPLAMLVCLRYSFDIESDDSDGDPITVVLNDWVLVALMAIWALVMIAGVYLS